ncbi:hypothetical protein GCM10010191_83980 [Actinomadura vinacea]|uniref:Uncharacterized protein n=2 Tax=Actinomadura vinacea TaxID=115336 RepID=A0ABN3K9C5_9ACTN
MIGPVPSPARVTKSGPARYTVLLVGLGAAGVAIGWLGPRFPASPAGLLRRR